MGIRDHLSSFRRKVKKLDFKGKKVPANTGDEEFRHLALLSPSEDDVGGTGGM